MSEAGDKIAAAIERHNASIEHIRGHAETLHSEREAAANAALGFTPITPPSAAQPSNGSE